MTMYFKPQSDGRVTGLRVPEDGKPIEGYLTVENEDVPAIPEAQEGFRPSLYYVDGKLEWRMIAEPIFDGAGNLAKPEEAQEEEAPAPVRHVEEEDEIF